MPEAYQLPVARLWNDRRSVAGAGFLAPRGFVVTCAHVVNDALGLDQLARDWPQAGVSLDLPWAGGHRFKATVIDWYPPVAPGGHRDDPCVDTAVLQLDGNPPTEYALSPQAPTVVPEDTAFRVMGFPDGANEGASARGTVRATDAGGWHHVEAGRSFGRTIEPGFSGAPAIADGSGRRLLGMIDITNHAERRGVLIPVEMLMRAWPPLAEPYRGLEAFREEDASYFFGRDALKERLWRSFERHPVTLLIGPSGSGKSSLINAGFIPRLRQQGCWRLLRFRPGDRPVARLSLELVRTLKPSADALELAAESAKLHEILLNCPDRLRAYAEALRATTNCGMCLVIDQLEETFTLAKASHPNEHTAILAALTNLTEQREPIVGKAVLGLRSDFQTLLQSDQNATGLVRAVDGEPTIMLYPLDAQERERVILGPLDTEHLNVTLENGLLGQLIEDIANNPDALPLLEFSLTALWARLHIDGRERKLTRTAYIEIGGITGALARHADSVLDELEIDKRQAKRLFIELVRVAGTIEQDARRPRMKRDLDAIDSELWPLAQKLATRRLVVTTAEPAVDIVHEALFRRWDQLARWIEEERAFLRWRQRLDERHREWRESGKDPRDLLTGRALEEASYWFARCRNALNNVQVSFIQASQQTEAAESARRQCDVLWDRLDFLWDRLELSWRQKKVPAHEIDALQELAHAPDMVRCEFLLAAANNDARARRFGRNPEVALRAALGLDLNLARKLAGRIATLLAIRAQLSPARTYAVMAIARELCPIAAELVTPTISLAVAGIAKTTDPDQLQNYGEVVRAFADRVDAAAAQAAVERAIAGIAEATTDQLRAYGEVVRAFAGIAKTIRPDQLRAFADRVDAAAAQAAVERAIAGIAKTTDPDQLRAYGEVVRTFADRFDAAAAQAAVERVIGIVKKTNEPDRDQLRAYGEVVQAFADRADAAAAQAAVERAIAGIAEATDLTQLWAYWVVRAFADRVDAAAAQAAVERAIAGIAEATADQLRAYREVVQAFADRVDAAAAQAAVERAIAGIAEATDLTQLWDYEKLVRTFADRVDAAAAQAAVERAIAGFAEATADQLRAYGEVVQAFADRVDADLLRTAAVAAVERAIASFAKTTDFDQLRAYREVVQAFADRVDAAAAQAAVERAIAGFAEATSYSDLQNYGEVVQAFADRVDADLLRTAAVAAVERAIASFAKTTDFDQLRAYGKLVQAFADRVDAAAAQAAVERAISGFAEATADQLRAYGKVVRAFADRVDADLLRTAAVAAVERAIAGIAPKAYRRNYGKVVQAFADWVDAAAAQAVVERVIAGIAEATDPDQLQNYGEVVRAFADRVDADLLRTAAVAAVERAIAGFAEAIYYYQLQNYGEVVRAFADWVDADLLRTAAVAAVERAISGIAKTTSYSDLQNYGEVVRAFADWVDADLLRTAAVAAVERAISGFAEATADQLRAYGKVVRAFADRVDADLLRTAAVAAVERVIAGIAKTTSYSDLQNYGEVVRAFADWVDADLLRTAAVAAVERAISGIPETSSECSQVALLLSDKLELVPTAITFLLTEVLKIPFAGYKQVSEQIMESIRQSCGAPELAGPDLWHLIEWLEKCEQWLPLRRPFGAIDIIRAEFQHLMKYGTPLPVE